MQYLVDSNWAIDYLNGNPIFIERLNRFFSDGVGINIIALVEVYRGAIYGRNPQKGVRDFEQLLQHIEIVPLDEAAFQIFARELLRLKTEGNIIPDNDILIAATAISQDLTLLTNDAHFQRIPNLRIISAA